MEIVLFLLGLFLVAFGLSFCVSYVMTFFSLKRKYRRQRAFACFYGITLDDK